MALSNTRDHIDRWFELNLDTKTRTIFLGSMYTDWDGRESGVDFSMAEYFIKGMFTLESMSNKKPIKVIMNNPGGDWYHGMAIFDAIKCSPCPVEIRVFGHAMSMGSIILQASRKRVVMPNGMIMIHYGYDGGDNHSKTIHKWSDQGKRLNEHMENIYIERIMERDEQVGSDHMEELFTNLCEKQRELDLKSKKRTVPKCDFSGSHEDKWEKYRVVIEWLCDFDTFITAEEAVGIGLADEIYEVK